MIEVRNGSKLKTSAIIRGAKPTKIRSSLAMDSAMIYHAPGQTRNCLTLINRKILQQLPMNPITKMLVYAQPAYQCVIATIVVDDMKVKH